MTIQHVQQAYFKIPVRRVKVSMLVLINEDLPQYHYLLEKNLLTI